MAELKLSLVIPAYNEGENIEHVVEGIVSEFRISGKPFQIIVVDNGSTDHTPKVLESLGSKHPELTVARVFPNRGYGNGILEGLKHATGDFVGWMHADLQLNPADVVRISQKLEESGADFAKGVRKDRFESRFRNLQSSAYNIVFAALFGRGYDDVNGTPKIFKRELLDELQLSSEDWFLDPEIMIKLIRSGREIVTSDVIWRSRKKGSSKVSIFAPLGFVKKLLVYKFFA